MGPVYSLLAESGTPLQRHLRDADANALSMTAICTYFTGDAHRQRDDQWQKIDLCSV